MGELGPLLTRAREARGLTIEDAERDTRISRRYLQALEAEHFEVIPAPVYARGFLRSYSQYLGLDPRETLALFPRDDEPSPYYAGRAAPPPQRTSPQAPQRQPQQAATVGAARPAWRRPPQQQPQPAQAEPPAARPRPGPPDPGWEPTIGIDIGVPAPARRLKTDPAAQARSMTVLVVAIAAIAAVVILAFAISRLGGGNAGGLPLETPTTTTVESGSDSTATVISGSTVTPGVMPNVIGLTEGAAVTALKAAGFSENAISVTRQSRNDPAGTVYEQYPLAGEPTEEGLQAIIAVSEGP